MSKDTRIVYGASCSWWDSIHKAGTNNGLPCCPNCQGMLFEVSNEKEFHIGAEEYNKKHPGYLDYLKWLRGKCFPNLKEAKAAYRKHEGSL